LRFGLLAYTIQSRYINLDVSKIVNQRLFCNKIWNSFKFAVSKFTENFKYEPAHLNFNDLNLLDQWILNRLNFCTIEMNKYLQEYKFGELTIAFHNFWLYELCDIYLEGIKPAFYKKDHNPIQTQTTLFTCFEQGLRLLHPIMPFITEELYQKMPDFTGKAESLVIAKYPEFKEDWNKNSKEINSNFDLIMNIAKAIRSMCSSANLPPSAKPQTFIVLLGNEADTKSLKELCQKESELITTLAKSKEITVLADKSLVPKGCIQDIVNNNMEVYVYLKEHIKAEDEIKRLQKKIEFNENLIEQQKKKMSVKDYDKKVPENVKLQNKEKLEGYLADNDKIREAILNMEKLL